MLLGLLFTLALAEPTSNPTSPTPPASGTGPGVPEEVPPAEGDPAPVLPAGSPVPASPPSAESVPPITKAQQDAWEAAWEDMNPWAALGGSPPNRSWDLALQLGMSDVAYWRGAPWHDAFSPASGLRLSAGKHRGPSRFGVAGSLNVEGPVIIYASSSLEVMGTWDWIARKRLIGASVGGAAMVHTMLDQDVGASLAPSAAVRMGYSQPYSSSGRRMFVVFEPKVRYVSGLPSITGMILVGQGRAID